MTGTVATWARYVMLDHWQSALSINALLHGTIIKGTLRLRPLLMYAYPFSFFSQVQFGPGGIQIQTQRPNAPTTTTTTTTTTRQPIVSTTRKPNGGDILLF